MSKYAPLTSHLNQIGRNCIPMKFSEIERVIGRSLPPSSREHRAWWSNNPSNNVMTKAWLAAGYETEQVNIAGEKLVFRRTSIQTDPLDSTVSKSRGSDGDSKPDRPLFGFMAGLITLAEGYDPTQPTGDAWAAESGRITDE